MFKDKRMIYFDSVVEQSLYEKGHPVTAFTERMRPTDVLNFVAEERIDRIEGNVIHVKRSVIVLDNKDYISKSELIQWATDQMIEITKRDDNVVTRLGMLAAFQMMVEKLNN